MNKLSDTLFVSMVMMEKSLGTMNAQETGR